MWKAGTLIETVERVNAKRFGLTMGLHSRIARAGASVESLAAIGNLYVNRSMIGAVVGSQPFGGEGLSGTGPKAGGPHYLPRFCVERVTSTDTTSAGGNATLLSLEDEGGRWGGENRHPRCWGWRLDRQRVVQGKRVSGSVDLG